MCLSGSYLVADSGGRDRTGGISVSLCSADGHVVGGGVSELIAASPVQVHYQFTQNICHVESDTKPNALFKILFPPCVNNVIFFQFCESFSACCQILISMFVEFA